MQRTTAIAVGLLFVLAIALAVVMRRQPPHAATSTHLPAPSASVSAAPVAAVAPSGSASASPSTEDSTEGSVGEAFDTLPDGRKVPELPASAPKEVSFGVVLVSYQGAQSAPKDARTKAEAKQKADVLLADAKRDFAEAVKKGDRGSTTDAGRVPRDVLEPAIEYLLFTLQKGDVYPDPVDTPRGYWILRRNN
jgi:hypothetical protein